MTVTLYHRSGSSWEKTVLTGVWARWSRGQSHTSGLPRDDAAASLLLIPWRADVSPAVGDGVLPGEGPDLADGPLKSQLPAAQVITKADCHRPGSPLDHWEVTAR